MRARRHHCVADIQAQRFGVVVDADAFGDVNPVRVQERPRQGFAARDKMQPFTDANA